MANRRFFINPAKETIAKFFFIMLFNYLCEIDKYYLTVIICISVLLSNHLCAQGFILAGIVNGAVQLAVSN